MTPELWQRLRPLFDEALQRPAPLRDAYVAEACAGDPELHHELQALLAAEQDATGPLGVQTDLVPAFHAALAAFQPGQLILQRFRIVRFISGGGMGEVYEADDLLLGKVALKTVRADIANSPDALRRLRQEVQLARRITGSAICRIHEFFLMPAERPHGPAAFISMEYIEGQTLAAYLHTRGPLPCADALRIALALCEGLCLIHEQGIIHRDLKTTNIMLCGAPGAERIVLMDFGLAHAARSHQSLDPLAETPNSTAPDNSFIAEAGIVGTPAYMAPEQFSGEPVTPATDLYALGIVLYELATGIQPYSASTPYGAVARRARKPPAISTLRRDFPHHWDRVIDCCLQYEPTERFQSAQEVTKALTPAPLDLRNLWQDHRGLVQGSFAILLCIVAWLSLLTWQALTIYRPSAEAARFYRNGVEALDDGTYLKATHALNAAIEHDPHFAMAHVRLAEAWNSLDFQVDAQQELLLANPGEHRLSPTDTLQLQAIRNEVTGDFHAATAAREQLIKKLPQDQLSAAYVELGFDRERNAQPEGALADYLKASSLDHENASAFLYAAILQSRLNRTAEGQQSFDRAEAIYRTQINQEGLANLHYERGYAANVLNHSDEARKLLDLSMHEAQQIPSVQLQIRTLQQLSNLARPNPYLAAAYATEAIRLARQNRLESWAAIGLVRLAAAQINLGKIREARETTNEALELARQTKQIRVEALANSQLANLENQEGRDDQLLGPAAAARKYYETNGFFNNAASVSLLIGRAQRSQGQYEQALGTAESARALAVKAGVRDLQRSAEELIGTINLIQENFPVALEHFQRARDLADAQLPRQDEDLRVSQILWRLGRYEEFQDRLDFEPANAALQERLIVEKVLAFLSSKKFSQVLAVIQSSSSQHPELADGLALDLLSEKALAEAELHHEAESLRDLALLKSQDENQTATTASQRLIYAQINLALGRSAEAEQNAHQAAVWFHANHWIDSDLQSSALEALIARREGHMSTAADLDRRCVDLVNEIRQTWPPDDVKTYLSRPDIKALLPRST